MPRLVAARCLVVARFVAAGLAGLVGVAVVRFAARRGVLRAATAAGFATATRLVSSFAPAGFAAAACLVSFFSLAGLVGFFAPAE